MVRRDTTQERLVSLFLAGVLLLVPPLLLVFNRPDRVMGIPVHYLYLFAAWAVLVLLAFLVARRIEAADGPTPPAPDAPRSPEVPDA